MQTKEIFWYRRLNKLTVISKDRRSAKSRDPLDIIAGFGLPSDDT
jgi:hypothetical protein